MEQTADGVYEVENRLGPMQALHEANYWQPTGNLLAMAYSDHALLFQSGSSSNLAMHGVWSRLCDD
jgi:hypothetical protein